MAMCNFVAGEFLVRRCQFICRRLDLLIFSFCSELLFFSVLSSRFPDNIVIAFGFKFKNAGTKAESFEEAYPRPVYRRTGGRNCSKPIA